MTWLFCMTLDSTSGPQWVRYQRDLLRVPVTVGQGFSSSHPSATCHAKMDTTVAEIGCYPCCKTGCSSHSGRLTEICSLRKVQVQVLCLNESIPQPGKHGRRQAGASSSLILLWICSKGFQLRT